MARAIWEGMVLAESGDTIEVEGNRYFPPESVKREFFQPSQRHTVCPWKGTANYYDVVVGEKSNPDAAWYYPEPSKAAANIRNYVAFWRGVRIED
jgi:uncharacterized protein (DUF427 family)